VAFDGREGAREKLEGFCQVLEEALVIAHKDLDRLILARELMNRVTAQCRSNSKLPELVELFLSRPLVTVPLEAKLLEVTPKSIDLMLIELGGALPHELTGRTRYCAWASLMRWFSRKAWIHLCAQPHIRSGLAGLHGGCPSLLMGDTPWPPQLTCQHTQRTPPRSGRLS
jgi:hypothetical protein